MMHILEPLSDADRSISVDVSLPLDRGAVPRSTLPGNAQPVSARATTATPAQAPLIRRVFLIVPPSPRMPVVLAISAGDVTDLVSE